MRTQWRPALPLAAIPPAGIFEVVNALDDMDDPIAKNTAAVNLFGTQFEDLQANVLPVLANMEDGAGRTYDALSQINQIKYDNLDSAIEGTKRSIQGVSTFGQ